MKVFSVVAFLLFLAFYLSSQSCTGKNASSIAPKIRETQVSGRRFMKERSSPTPKVAVEGHNSKVHERLARSSTKVYRLQEEPEKSEEGFIYNADYHGVQTHPSPLPKHLRP